MTERNFIEFSFVECNSYETHNIYPNLGVPISDQQQLMLNKINEIKDYFVAEIKLRELMSKRLSKYIASFDYFDYLIVLSVTTGSISIASFATAIGAPVGMISASFSLSFVISTGIVKTLLKTTKNKRKKHNRIVMIARSKLSSIEIKISFHEVWKIAISKRATCGNKKSSFNKNQEAKGLLSSLSPRTRLSKVSLLGDILLYEYITNEIVNKFLLAGDKFMPEMHLKQPGFTYNAGRPFTKNKERIQKFKETRVQNIFTEIS